MAGDKQTFEVDAGEARQWLERFVVENDDLLKLESRIRRFNIFDALRITRAEIRHSNFLAFILDPVESHGQGQLFLKALLMDLLKAAPAELRPLSPIDLDGTDLRGVEVRREWKNIDLLITCKEPSFAVVIENKVRSQEHSNQLSKYARVMAEHYPTLRRLHVFLTPDGDEPSEDSWVPYTYTDIHTVFTRTRDSYQNAIGDDVLAFLDHYLNLLGTRFMNDEELDELCRRIYKNHRQALDLIWQRIGSPESSHFSEVLSVLEEDPRWHLFYKSNKYVDFVPKQWQQWLPVLTPSYPICADLYAREQQIELRLFAGPMHGIANRSEIIMRLRDAAPKCGFKATKTSKIGRYWVRVAEAETFIQWDEEQDADPESLRVLAAGKLDDIHARMEKLAPLLKPLFSQVDSQ